MFALALVPCATFSAHQATVANEVIGTTIANENLGDIDNSPTASAADVVQPFHYCDAEGCTC
jgi:hypothetical protein